MNKAPYLPCKSRTTPTSHRSSDIVPPFSLHSFPCWCVRTRLTTRCTRFPLSRSLARQPKSKKRPIKPRTNTTPHLTIYRLSPPMQSTHPSPPIVTSTDAEPVRGAQHRPRAYPVTVKQAPDLQATPLPCRPNAKSKHTYKALFRPSARSG